MRLESPNDGNRGHQIPVDPSDGTHRPPCLRVQLSARPQGHRLWQFGAFFLGAWQLGGVLQEVGKKDPEIRGLYRIVPRNKNG